MQQHKYLTPKEVQEIYKINVGTLANWRLYGKGPAYIKVGRLVRYESATMEAYFLQNRVLTIDQPGEKPLPSSGQRSA